MSRTSDRDRILRLLEGSEGLSSRRIKDELDLTDERYGVVRSELIEAALAEKYVCRGGGLRLTRAGESKVPDEPAAHRSSYKDEKSLYLPFVEWLRRQAAVEESLTVVCPTHSLRKRGQWQNPDVTELTVEHYKNLRKTRITVTTWEVKQFPRWDVDAVFEAASHHRFSSEAYVVLEWPRDLQFSLTDSEYRVADLVRECQRFGVGLATLEKHYASVKLKVRLDPRPVIPRDEDVEQWLGYAFSRLPDCEKEFDKLFSVAAE